VITNDTWPDVAGALKTNTVLKYDQNLRNVEATSKPVELFKLHLGNMPDKEKPVLPKGLDYKKAITDYLTEMGLISTQYSEKLQLSTERELYTLYPMLKESEAAAIYCMRTLKEHMITEVGSSFMIVDCGGGTVDLTTRELLENSRLGEITERSGDFCGGTYVDKEFIKFLKRRVGDSAISLLHENHYGQLQYMVQEFCRRVKLPFTGNKKDFKTFELDIEEVCPVLKQYVSETTKIKLDKDDWIIDLEFENVKEMFDPVVGKIIRLISNQLNAGAGSGTCAAMFLVVLKWTYGIELSPQWKKGDPPERKISHGRINVFSKLVSRGTIVDVDEEFGKELFPSIEDQSAASMKIYKTPAYDGKYPDEPGMEKLGELILDFPDSHLGFNRKLEFTLTFGQMEIRAYCKNQNGKSVDAIFNLEF
ncbi:8468_t:CDS:2, partial [Racocetra fulgida]